METIDFAFREIQDLEEKAKSAPDGVQRLNFIVKAAHLSFKYSQEWLEPLGKKELLTKARHLILLGERLKRDDGTVEDITRFQTEALEVALAPLKVLQSPVSSLQELSKKDKILILKGSKFGGNKFPPWSRSPGVKDFDEIPDKIVLHEPLHKSITPTVKELTLSQEHLQHFQSWARAVIAIPPPSLLQDGTSSPSMIAGKPFDLIQDVGVDCSVVASICALIARVEIGQKVLSKIIYPFDNIRNWPLISQNGRYWLRFYFNGAYRCVIIDDRLPLSKSDRILHIIDRNNPSLLWPALLEKAYLQIWGGYDFLGSNSNTDLFIISGWIPELIILSESHLEDCLWAKMIRGLRAGVVLITLGTPDLGKEVEQNFGLVSNHNYAVLDLKLENSQAFVLIKNPWREPTVWQKDTDTSLNSVSNTPASRGDLNAGAFWIPYEEVFKYFHWAYLNWNPGLFKYREDIHFSWDVRRKSMTNCTLKTPQFAVRSNKKGESSLVWLLLARHFQDFPQENGDLQSDLREPHESGGNSKELQDTTVESRAKHRKPHATGDISIWVFSTNGERVYSTDIDRVTKGRFVDAMHTLVRISLPANTSYTILPRQQFASIGEQNFTLTAFSDDNITLSDAKDIYGHSTAIDSEWWWRTAAGNINTPEFSNNPQFMLEVTSKTLVAMSLESWNAEMRVNVMLHYGKGERIFSVKNTTIALGTTEYKPGYSIIQTPTWQPLEPGRYTIVVSTFEAGQEGKFTLRIDSTIPVTITPIADERFSAGNYDIELPSTVFIDTISAISMQIYPTTQLMLRVVVKFGSSYYPGQMINVGESSSGRRSPLRISIEQGVGPNKQIIAQSNGGHFEDAGRQGQRLVDVQVDDTMATHGNLYLVIERMTGCGVPGSEERFHTTIIHRGGQQRDQLQVANEWRIWDDTR